MTVDTETERNDFLGLTREAIRQDYRIAFESRQASLFGRREVLTGKAKFGIFGDGKEVAQVALARSFRPGDVRAGYYRDQTLMFALGLSSVAEFFSQLYADPDARHETASAGRQMTAHFATRFLEPDGSWRDLAQLLNSSADLSPTGSQMPRLVGLAQASKLYRALDDLPGANRFSNDGNEIAWGTIGNASCAEGLFWETVNAVGVLQVPLLLSIWDDGYGISVHNDHQVTKGDISAILRGFASSPGEPEGFVIHRVNGWDYPALCETYASVSEAVRRDHVPAIVHVVEMTQPQGHSTSGSHERYKSAERLEWEKEFDCILRMRGWMIAEGVASAEELESLEAEARESARSQMELAWRRFREPIESDKRELAELLERMAAGAGDAVELVKGASARLGRIPNPGRRELVSLAQDALVATVSERTPARSALSAWKSERGAKLQSLFSSHLMSESAGSALAVEPLPAVYSDASPEIRGFEILNAGFDAAFARDPYLLAFGEDVGQLGDVNQGLAGLQEKYGHLRVADTGIREATIMGQAIGLALRGFRPIAEIQYLDYFLYALQIVSDDLATLHWRTAGGQKAPVIIRSRGHRLEGVWHSGSPMAGILNLVRGLHVCVPRNMTQAVGMYNTLLAADDPGPGRRGPQRLPAQRAQAGQSRPVPAAVGRAGSAARRRRRDRRHLRCALPNRDGGRGAAVAGRRRLRADRRTDAPSLRPSRRRARLSQEDEPDRLSRRGRTRGRNGLHDAEGNRRAVRLRLARRRAPDDLLGRAPACLRLGRGLRVQAEPREHLCGDLPADAALRPLRLPGSGVAGCVT